MNLKNENYSAQFKQLKPTFVGNHLPWLSTAREESLTRFLCTGFPNRHQENWKYTDLTFLTQQTFTCTSQNESITPELIAKYRLENINTHQLVFVDGYFSTALSQTNNLPAGITLISLNKALLTQPEIVKPYLEENLNSPLIDLNTAFITDGVFLHITKNAHIASPIYLLFLSTDINNNAFINHRNIIVLEENSQATLFEEHATLAQNSKDILLAKNIVTNITIRSGAQLNHYKLQQESNHTVHIARTDVNQSRDSQLNNYSISLGAKLARDDLNVNLNDTGASCELSGFYALSDNQHTDHHTRVDHYHPFGTSNECYKGILNDHAKGVFNGKIVVHPQAQKTRSQQINKNLLLSKTAEINTKPELEIYADDVQCTHGATVGQLELDALFYLRSRGINEEDAVNLLTHAFCEDVLNRMRHEQIASYMKKAIEEKIG